MKKQNVKTTSGITLIALVITILVLLILAGVSITALSDEDKGVVTKAKEAAEKTETAATEEDEEIQNILEYADEDIPVTDPGTEPEPEPEPIEGVLADLVTPSNYGEKINYISPNGITSWKIFYNDGDNVFIISSDYLLNDYLPANVKMGTLDSYPYSAYWPANSTTLDEITINITNAVRDKYLLSWYAAYPSSTNDNIKATASLLDTTVWDEFVNTTYADSAIGAPTLDMFCESWNGKYSSDKIYYDVMSEVGYYVTALAPADRTEAVTTTFISVSQDDGYGDTLYFPYTDETNGCNGYWLASPSTFVYNEQTAPAYIYQSGTVGASQAGCCGTGSAETAGADLAARPVICLNSEVEVSYVDGQWYLK